jgi:hypothetical protein
MKKSSWVILFQSILMIGFLIFSVVQKMEADKSKAIALSNQREAIKQKQIATQERERAVQQYQLAKRNALEALEQKSIAEKESQIARAQTALAFEQSKLKNPQTYQKELERLTYKNDSLEEASNEVKKGQGDIQLLKAQVKDLKEMSEFQMKIIDSLKAK